MFTVSQFYHCYLIREYAHSSFCWADISESVSLYVPKLNLDKTKLVISKEEAYLETSPSPLTIHSSGSSVASKQVCDPIEACRGLY